jgi:hypothetical protein
MQETTKDLREVNKMTQEANGQVKSNRKKFKKRLIDVEEASERRGRRN